jgi:hypothetical protein
MRAWLPAPAALLAMSCSTTPAYRLASSPEANIAGRLLAVHNAERAAFGAPPLSWDPGLAASAQAYAQRLAAIGRLQHSSRAERPGQGENLWIGSRGAFSVAAMAGSWANERVRFVPGRFPAVSRSGNWADVGHYTQMVWPGTSRLGCGLASSPRWDVLVCRYGPAGNVDGAMLAPR